MGTSSSDDPSRGAVARVGLAVFAGALLVATYDLTLAAWTADPYAAGAGGLLWFTPLIVLAVPCTLALLAVSVTRLASAARNRFGERRVVGLALDLVLASPLLVLVPKLFSGPSIGASPCRWPAMIGAMLAAVAGARLLRCATSRLAAGVAGSGRARWPSLAAAVALLVVGIAGPHWATISLLPGLYDGFHQGLSLISIMVCSASLFALGHASVQLMPGRRALVAAALAMVLGWPLGAVVTRDEPLARQLLADHAPFTGAFSEQLFTISRLFALDLGGAEPGSPAARFAGLSAARFADQSPKRDVLLITVDALRGDALDPHGRFEERTASLRAATAGGLRYTRAYSPSNNTTYSIPGLLYGYVPQSGETPPPDETVASAFARGGYRTVFHFTAHEYGALEQKAIWPLAQRGFYFERYRPDYDDAATVLSETATNLENSDDPIFVWAHLSEVHSPFLLRGKRDSDARRFEETYEGQLGFLDSVLGPWLAATLARYPGLVWAVSSDHGESLGEHGRRYHGSSLFDEQVRVPLLLGGPGIAAGTIDAPVSNSALPATLLSLAGADLPDSARTLPLAPQQARPGERVLIVGSAERCAVVEQQHKLIASPAKGIVALYDLERDPGEKTNLVEELPDAARRLLEALPGLGCPFDLSGLHATTE